MALGDDIGIIAGDENAGRQPVCQNVGHGEYLLPHQVDIENRGIQRWTTFDQLESFFHAPGRPGDMNAALR
jgi:hypothetical protein